MNTADLIAIDTHPSRGLVPEPSTATARSTTPPTSHFRSSKRPTMDETIAFYRELKIGFVNFTVDAETQMGRRGSRTRRSPRRRRRTATS
jgi:hypothetical protein